MITIILGMHRSGTSTVAGVLHLNKIIMGTYQNFWPRPLTQNPKGFYENYDFRKINDELLNKAGYDVKTYEPQIPYSELTDRMYTKMKKLVCRCHDQYPDWGWKDPRTCLTVDQWASVIRDLNLQNDLKIIFVTRKAISVARSLNKRNELPLKQGMDLWKTYTERALEFCQDSALPTFYCSFEGLLNDPVSICNSLFDFLDRPLDPSIVDQFIDRGISTSGSGEELDYPGPIAELETKINSLLRD